MYTCDKCKKRESGIEEINRLDIDYFEIRLDLCNQCLLELIKWVDPKNEYDVLDKMRAELTDMHPIVSNNDKESSNV